MLGYKRLHVVLALIVCCLVVIWLGTQWLQQGGERWGLLGPSFMAWMNRSKANQELKRNARTISGLCLTALTAALASSVGSGGGAFFVPVFNLIIGLDLKSSTGLSQACIAAAAAAAVVVSIRKRHPEHPSKPLPDFDAILLLAPALLMGVSVGVALNAIFPDWLITLGLVVLLGYICQHTVRKGLADRRKALQEKDSQQQQAGDSHHHQAQQHQRQQNEKRHNRDDEEAGDHGQVDDEQPPLRYPKAKLLAVVALWASVAGLQLLLNSQQECSMGFWAVFACQLLWAVGATALAAKVLLRIKAGHGAAAASEDSAEGDGSADGVTEALLPQQGSGDGDSGNLGGAIWGVVRRAVQAALVGLVAGLMGQGGGSMFNPLLLHLGEHPLATISTSNILVLIGSSSGALDHALAGRLLLKHAAVFGAVAFVSCMVGVTALTRLEKRIGPHVIVLILGAKLGAGALAAGVYGAMNAWRDWNEGHSMGFENPCGHGD